MQARTVRTRAGEALRRLFHCTLVVSIATSTRGADEDQNLKSIRIREQWSQVQSLHIRLRQETILSAEADAVAAWRSRPNLPKYSGSEDLLFALDGEKRYSRILGLECQAIGFPGSRPAEGDPPTLTYDEARVWDGVAMRERIKDRDGRFRYRAVAPAEAVDSFPPPEYLMNVGFSPPDPTASLKTSGQLRSTWFLPAVLESPSYTVAETIEQIGGKRSLVLQRAGASATDSTHAASADLSEDKLWLDLEHGLALWKRELRIDNRLVRVVNDDFVQVLPGLWIPGQSRTEHFAPPNAATQYQGPPVLVRKMRLTFHVVNQVPSHLFDTALTEGGPLPRSLFDVVRAYHYKSSRAGTEEVWALEGVGRRSELRKGQKLLLLRIDTPAWSLLWRPTLNRATLLPSRLEDRLRQDASLIRSCGAVIRSAEELTAVLRLQVDHVDNRRADKLTAYYPADPLVAGNWPIHEFDPVLQRKVSGSKFRTREYWFDPTTGLLVHRRCGCKQPKWEATIDFPAPEDIEKRQFKFRLPDGASLNATDKDLKRLFLLSLNAASQQGIHATEKKKEEAPDGKAQPRRSRSGV